jgi:hypothetical protein
MKKPTVKMIKILKTRVISKKSEKENENLKIMDKMDNLINQTQIKYNNRMKMMRINLKMIKMKSSQIM